MTTAAWTAPHRAVRVVAPLAVLAALLGAGQAHAATAGMDNQTSDSEQAARLYLKAANSGDATGWRGLGWMYHSGKGVARDDVAAFGWYIKGAQAGDAPSQVMVARMYLSGAGVPKDIAQGQMWLRRAIDAGDLDGITLLGRLYLFGEPLGRDDKQGIQLLTRAAIAGNANAQYWLADAYMTGKHVRRDQARADAWLLVASKNGSEDARAGLNANGFLLSRDQVTRAAQAAHQWHVGVDLAVAPEPVGGTSVGQFNLNAPFAPGL